VSAPRTLRYQDLLAWHRCPLGAAHGYVPEDPQGDPKLARQILGRWPKTNTLARAVPKRDVAVRWLQATRFGIVASLEGAIAPPPAVHPDDYWLPGEGKAWRGISSFETPLGERVYAEYDLPYLHRVGGVYEVVILDTHLTPPDIQRRAALVLLGSYLTSGFHRITGEVCYARLVAPAYQHEEALTLPHQSSEVVMSALALGQTLPVMRPGSSCMETQRYTGRSPSGRPQTLHRWACPLREAGKCVPFNPNRNA
jgi:hypothetical protein